MGTHDFELAQSEPDQERHSRSLLKGLLLLSPLRKGKLNGRQEREGERDLGSGNPRGGLIAQMPQHRRAMSHENRRSADPD